MWEITVNDEKCFESVSSVAKGYVRLYQSLSLLSFHHAECQWSPAASSKHFPSHLSPFIQSPVLHFLLDFPCSSNPLHSWTVYTRSSNENTQQCLQEACFHTSSWFTVTMETSTAICTASVFYTLQFPNAFILKKSPQHSSTGTNNNPDSTGIFIIW